MVLIALGIAVDVLAWRSRKLASLILYYEMINTICQSFCPHDQGDFEGIVLVALILALNSVFFCDLKRNSVACVATTIIILFVCYPIVYS